MILIINNRTFILNDNSSWKIRPKEGYIAITRLECDNEFNTPILGDENFAEDVATMIAEKIAKGAKIIHVKTTNNIEILVK